MLESALPFPERWALDENLPVIAFGTRIEDPLAPGCARKTALPIAPDAAAQLCH
jgi:hypothetical protein